MRGRRLEDGEDAGIIPADNHFQEGAKGVVGVELAQRERFRGFINDVPCGDLSVFLANDDRVSLRKQSGIKCAKNSFHRATSDCEYRILYGVRQIEKFKTRNPPILFATEN